MLVPLSLPVQLLDPELGVPAYEHPGDAGLDLRARTTVTINPGEHVVIPTGIAVAIPTGTLGFITPRSGLAAKHALSIVNTPGTIDAGYRGELAVIAINHHPSAPVTIERGQRIAQLIIMPVFHAQITVVDVLDDTVRGTGGFGSSGTH